MPLEGLRMIDFTALDNNSNKLIPFSHDEFNEIIDYSALSTGNPLVDEKTKTIIEQSFLIFTGNPKNAEELSFGDSSWNIKVTPNLVKTSVVASIMIGLLYATGATQLASLVLPAVLPLLIDIDSIKLSVKDDLILAEMRRHDELKDKEFWPQEIYDQLHPTTQEQFTFSEFLDVLNVLMLTGNVDKDDKTGLFQLNEKKKLRISIS